MDNPYTVHQCSMCLGDTEYHCVSCPRDLCPQCKEKHAKDLKTIDHKVVPYRDKINYIPKQEICVRNPSKVYINYCKPCQCYHCIKHRNHRQIVVGTSYETKLQQHIGTIHTIRSDALFYRPVLLSEIKDDFKTCHTQFSLYQSKMLTKAQKQKDLIDYIQKDFMCNSFCDFDFKHRCLKQKIEMGRHIVSLQRFVHIYEQSAFPFSALKFISFMKTVLPPIYLTLHTSQLSITESINKEDIMGSLSAIQITERGNRRVENQGLLKIMSGVEFHQSIKVAGINCHHISCVTSDRAWISGLCNRNKLILTNTTGVPLHCVEDSCEVYHNGIHTVNSESELFYIDKKYNINKLSKDMKTTTTFIERTNSIWKPHCVYLSPSTGDLLVGLHHKLWAGKITRYNQSGHPTQTIEHDNTGRQLYSEPIYITENNNGDVVASNKAKSSAVVVTDREGRHRFSYTGHPSGSGLQPCAICTDALSHILVCDKSTNTVQMLDMDGHFLSYILTTSETENNLLGLSYDFNTHRLWVGSSEYSTIVYVYRYITRQDALTDQSRVRDSLSGIPTTGTDKPQQEKQCMLKLLSSPELLHSLTLTGVHRCYHISCVTSDRVCVSDRYNLILTNRIGALLHRVEESFSGCYSVGGLHTVNSESELIYIPERYYSINKLSKDMKKTTTVIKRTDYTWRPWCVYCSPATGDLLIGMYYMHKNVKTGKVTRYTHSGKLTQTIQYDSTGRGLYRCPIYITENNNGDVAVSDWYGYVVVTEHGGRHRFSYTGHPSGSGLEPYGICTDALSHILVCDNKSKTVQMLSKDGQFLSHLLTKSQEMGVPRSLSYDFNTHCLWVGSLNNNKVCVYRYITRQGPITDLLADLNRQRV